MKPSSLKVPASKHILLVTASVAALTAPLAAIGPETLVADLNQTSGRRDSDPAELHRVGDRVVFAASDPVHGYELRGTGRDLVGIELLADATPGTADSAIRLEAELDGVLFYSSGTMSATSLWVTDGTPAGTRQVRDGLGSALGPSAFGWFETARWGEALAVIGMDATSGADSVWSVGADGSAVRVHRAPLSRYPGALFGLAAAGGGFYFQEEDPDTFRHAVWVSDGTAAGTRPVVEDLGYARYAAGGTSRLYFFTASDEAGRDVLHATDGSVAGTVALAAFGPYPEIGPQILVTGTSRAYFLAGSVVSGLELWVSDGTLAGTFPVPGAPGESGYSFDSGPNGAWIGEMFVFSTYAYDDARIWAHDGSRRPAVPLPTAHLNGDLGTTFVALDGQLLFTALNEGGSSSEVWRTDGTAAGTRQVSHLCPDVCESYSFESPRRVGGVVLFQVTYEQSRFGAEWWTIVSDGTDAGTRVVNDSNVGPVAVIAGSPSWAARVDGGFLVAGWEWRGTGVELWQVGLGGGPPRLVANFEPERWPSSPRRLLGAEGHLFWVAAEDRFNERGWFLSSSGAEPESAPPEICDGAAVAAAGQVGRSVVTRDWGYGSFDCLASYDLDTGEWRELQSPDGSSVLQEPFVRVAGRIFFVQRRSGPSSELWATDGTPEGTVRWDASGLPEPFELVGASSTHLFLRDVYYAHALYALPVEGGVAQEIAPLDLEWTFGRGTEAEAAGARYFFTLRELDGSESLRASDGSAEGTQVVWSSVADEARLLDVFPWGESMLFLVGSDRMTLWRSDGTLGGTLAVADLGTLDVDADDFATRDSVAYGGRLFFTAETAERGAELWATDGSAAGTVPFDLVPGPASSAPRWLASAGGTLFFAAEAPGFGREVWASDGTLAGTRRVTDIAAGAASAEPEEMVAVGSTLYFAADDGFRDRELWSIDADGADGCVPSERRLCLRGGRFAVEGAWRDFEGRLGTARTLSLGDASGAFWFFDPANVEAVVKLLDGRPLNDHFWLFYGALSNVEYDLQVTDTEARVTRHYSNPAGRYASVGDVEAFAAAPESAATSKRANGSERESALALAAPPADEPTGPCVATAARLCLHGERFAVQARWRDFAGNEGVAGALPWTADTGRLWFFDPENPELIVKLLDGGAVNGRFWLFSAALSNVEYVVTVTDLVTGAVREYVNPSGTFASFGDVDAF